MKMKLSTLLLLLLVAKLDFAQPNPGGVSANLKLWVRSNSGISTTGSLVNSWTYVNDGTKSFTASGTGRPTLVANGLNFNSSVRFIPDIPLHANSNVMDGPAGVNAPITAGDDTYTAFVVWMSPTTTQFQRIWSQRNPAFSSADAFAISTWDGSFPGPAIYGAELGIPPFSQGILRGYTGGVWNISQINMLPEGAGDIEVVDDRNISTGILTLSSGAARTLGDIYNRMGDNFNGDSPLDGDIAELIVYDASISAGADRNRIFSYLAMKYGVTLKTNLVNAAGTVLWDATANATYNNDVFGFVRDDASGLTVNSSNSLNTGSGNGTGQSAKGNIVISNPSDLDNNEALMIGHDAGALTESVSPDLPILALGSSRLAREWRVQETGHNNSLNLSFDINGLTVTGTTAANFRLIVDADGNGDFTNGTVRYYTPNSFSGGVLGFNGIALSFRNNEVFTLITNAAVATPLPVTWKDFNINLVNKDAHLNWSVENNADANRYEVEHSTDGIVFLKIATVPNIPAIKSYGFVDRGLLSGTHFYRIKQIDNNGVTIYSKIINVTIKNSDFTIFLVSNPVKGSYAEVGVNASRSGSAKIELWSVTGAKINTQSELIGTGTNKIKVPMDRVAPGNYILKVNVNDQLQTLQVVKQ